MKTDRQSMILEIIEKEDVDTQEQLQQRLQEQGVRCTQATISRDIKELNLVKQPGRDGNYRYVCPAPKPAEHSFAGRLKNIFKEGVASCEAAQNIVVVKTMPGLAPAAAAALDGMELEGFVGSLAGDDTAILIMRTSRVAEELTQEIESMLEG